MSDCLLLWNIGRKMHKWCSHYLHYDSRRTMIMSYKNARRWHVKHKQHSGNTFTPQQRGCVTVYLSAHICPGQEYMGRFCPLRAWDSVILQNPSPGHDPNTAVFSLSPISRHSVSFHNPLSLSQQGHYSLSPLDSTHSNTGGGVWTLKHLGPQTAYVQNVDMYKFYFYNLK